MGQTPDNPASTAPTLRPRTQLVHGGTRRSGFEETSEALFLTSGFIYASAEEAEAAFVNDGSRFVYSRFRNPTVVMLEERLAGYEGFARCIATASGMAAVHLAVMGLLKAGDRVVAPHALFGSCLYIVKDLAPRYGIQCTLVEGTDLAQWEEALSTPASVVFLESPSNPTMQVVDVAAVADLAHKAGARVVVDNVFATPVLQRPKEFGADVVVYSATKHIDGQGRCLGGAVLCDDEVATLLSPVLRHTGPSMSPFNAWVLLKGLETLELRVNAQAASALALAQFLESHPAVSTVLYPGLPSHPQHDLAMRQMKTGGTVITFDVTGGKEAAFRLLNTLKIIKISNNLGDAKSLITHNATTTHQRLTDEEKAKVGIGPGTLRLSVGLEDADDLRDDLAAGLAAAAG
ncbi:O-succinylhomoserine sulfhydrylase [Nitrospirillum sp. BR 11828]|uniref:O-succinylhomoserine sulfhydrylase n=1 Tax=Nitrospirillum sp. BR 11828 TaxID=3104325 RepID=UPI002ACA45A9|nr:O-succinylhomoserine sulfhydrylase [Nitrospirillum sp. BR 11828]MDZ5646790.1 O-succinylhomoserine sulfhydrylase [Nitrospirillum sp. BR 11828]